MPRRRQRIQKDCSPDRQKNNKQTDQREACPWQFFIVGDCCQERAVEDASISLADWAQGLTEDDLGGEFYLSAFRYGHDFDAHVEQTGSTGGYEGLVWAAWITIDIDSTDLRDAQRATIRLVETLERYGLSKREVLVFFSGAKGFHVVVPAVWAPEPSVDFPAITRRFCLSLADEAGVTIDPAAHSRVQPIRSPNSRHPKSELFKRRISIATLEKPVEQIQKLAKKPALFEMPEWPRREFPALAALWRESTERVRAPAARVARAEPDTDADEKVEILLELIDSELADEYHEWVRIGMLVASATGLSETGFSLWDAWSRESSNYGETRIKWRSFRKGEPGKAIAALRRMANEHVGEREVREAMRAFDREFVHKRHKALRRKNEEIIRRRKLRAGCRVIR